MMNYLVQFNELKDWKSIKPKFPYGSKVIQISKIELEDICQKLNIDDKYLKYISSGSLGNAYLVDDDKILKITSDKGEASMAFDLIDQKNPSIIKYYGVWRYNLRGKIVYIILMEKVTDLISKIKKLNRYTIYNDFIQDVSDIIFYNWGKLTYKEYIERVEDEYNIGNGFGKLIVHKIWMCYKYLKSYPLLDFHKYNLGFTKDNRLVLFDVSPIKTIRKFDNVPILK